MVKKIFTTKEIAEYCDVTQRTVIQWINEGKITAFRTPGNHSKVKREDFLVFLKKYNIPVPQDLQEGSGKKSILIVDDDEFMVNAIRRALSEGDAYEMDSAGDGFAAGQKFITKKPDLVILDLRMPKVDGYQLCKAIRNDPNNKHVKILIVSGIIDDAGKGLKEMGADDYLKKPFDNKDLCAKVERLLK